LSLFPLPTYWIGGSPCSGKSSIATQLAGAYGLLVYSCDEHFPTHQRRADPSLHPALHALSSMSWDEIWMRPIEQQVEKVFIVYREEFGMILEDLESIAGDRPLLVEGSALLPELVVELLDGIKQAVWVVPSPDFQVRYYSQREWVQGILKQCRDPQTAFRNWMERDAQFAERVATQAIEMSLEVIHVDGRLGTSELADRIASQFGLQEEV
jgi:hypothetical protein